MASKLSQGEILQIFGIVLAIGKSDTYSISVDFDTEWNSMDIRLWHSPTEATFDIVSTISDKNSSFAEILRELKAWTKIIMADRGDGRDSTN